MRAGRVAVVGVALLTLAVGPAQTVPPPFRPAPSFWPPPVLSEERAIAEVVRVDSRGGGAFDTGTGVSVGAHVVLTNAHLTRNPITLVTRCGEQLLAVDRVERATGADDVAVLVTTGPSLLPVYSERAGACMDMDHFVAVYFIAWMVEKLPTWYPGFDNGERKTLLGETVMVALEAGILRKPEESGPPAG